MAEVPVRPWGVQVVASESGTGTDSSTVFVGLPAGRTYDNPEMLIVLSPTLERMLIELALGRCGVSAPIDVLSSNCEPANLAAVRHDRRSRGRSAGGDRGAAISPHGPRDGRARGRSG